MKKIMFNDRFALTEKVLDGSKTQIYGTICAEPILSKVISTNKL